MHMICQSMLNSCGMRACRHSAAATTISCQIWQQKYGAHLRPFLCPATVVRPVPSTHLQRQACGQRSGAAGAHLCCVYGAVADRIRRRCQSRRSPPPAYTQQVIPCRNGTQMKAFACAMAHAKARWHQRWQTWPLLWRMLPIFRAMSSRAEAF